MRSLLSSTILALVLIAPAQAATTILDGSGNTILLGQGTTYEVDGGICTNACLSYGETDITPDYLGRFGPAFGDLRGDPFKLVITNGDSYSLTINNHTVNWMQGDSHIAISWTGGWTTSFTTGAFKWTDTEINAYGIAVSETLYGCPTDPVPGVPEPATWAMMLIGMAGLAGLDLVRRRRRRVATV